jgi:hypothetical protein
MPLLRCPSEYSEIKCVGVKPTLFFELICTVVGIGFQGHLMR